MSRLLMGPPADDPSLPRRCAARNRASIRRAMRAASAVPISPRPNAAQTRRIARCTCSRVRIDDSRRPIRSAGSCAETGGRNSPRSRRNSQGWRLNNALHASGFPARPTVSPCAALGSGYRAAGRRDCRNGPERTGPARPSRLGPSRPGPSRARARGAEKDQDQAVELPRFRSRNAAKSSERSVDRRFPASARAPQTTSACHMDSCYVSRQARLRQHHFIGAATLSMVSPDASEPPSIANARARTTDSIIFC